MLRSVDDVAGLVVVDVDVEQPGVRNEADENEHPSDVQLLACSVLLVAHGLDLVLPDDLFHVRVEDELDLGGSRARDRSGLAAPSAHCGDG